MSSPAETAGTETKSAAPPEKAAASGSPWSPFAHRAFFVLWVATVLSNVGTWMHDVGAGWLMTELDPSPMLVAGVQAATTAPIFLFALIAGATADIVDRRKLLLLVNGLMMLAAGGLAALVALGAMTPALLILFTFLLGTGAAFMAPAWQAIVPQLVPRSELSAAIALNSMGINVSRAIGPALAGFLIVALGLAAPFALNALSFIGILAAIYWWRAPEKPVTKLPSESLTTAMFAGLRYALHSPALKGTLVRATAFFTCASAYWAMLPLIAKQVLEGGPTLYGIMLTAVGAGAVGGALLLPSVKKRLGPDKTVAAGSFGTALVLVLLAVVPSVPVAVVACGLAGISWIAVLSSLHVSAQTSLPDWVRARGLSIFLMVFFGSMSGGSLVWGGVASAYGVPTALVLAAFGATLLVALSWRFKLNQAAGDDLAPSGHWPDPQVHLLAEDDRGPVMIEVRYCVPEENRARFLTLLGQLAEARRRGGAFGWRLMQEGEAPDRFAETWMEASWLEHLRHHERVSGDDRALQAEIRTLLIQDPQVRHFFPPA